MNDHSTGMLCTACAYLCIGGGAACRPHAPLRLHAAGASTPVPPCMHADVYPAHGSGITLGAIRMDTAPAEDLARNPGACSRLHGTTYARNSFEANGELQLQCLRM